MIVIDQRGMVQEFNPAAERLFGYTAEEMLGMSVNLLMPPAVGQHHDRYVRNARDERAPSMAGGRRVNGRRKDGAEFPIEVTVAEAYAGEQRIHVGVVRDISERQAFEQRLMQLATTDELTGALTRRAFLEAATDTALLARRHHHPLSVLMLDLDHLKKINDSYGHPTGDRVLREAAAALHEALRSTDRLGRLGGEEFAVMLPATDGAAATHTAQRLLEAVRAIETTSDDGRSLRFTISIGVASAPPGARDIDALIKSADDALYAAKSGGRDRWQLAG